MAHPDLIHFRAGHNGIPAIILHSAALQFRTFTYGVLREGGATAFEILRFWWQEIVDDIGEQRQELAAQVPVLARFSVIFHGRGLVWRSVVMDFDTFEDPVLVEIALEEARPGSDLEDIEVEWLEVEVIERPGGGRRRDMVRGASARSREEKRREDEAIDAELDAMELNADFFADDDFKLDDEGNLAEPPEHELDEKYGAYDQKRIEKARPAQTLEWYAKKHPNLLLAIRNKGNNRCLEYAIAAHDKQNNLRAKGWIEKEKKEGKDMTQKEKVLAAGLAKATQRKVSEYMRYTGHKSQWAKDAMLLAKTVLGEAQAGADEPRALKDLVKYHNKLNTRFQVFTYNDAHAQKAERIKCTWELPDAKPLPENSPLISLLWTPPPVGSNTGHFDLIPAGCDLAVAYLGSAPGFRFCPVCCQTFSRHAGHKCEMFCFACGQFGCPNRKGRIGVPKRCDSCHRRFWGDTCFANHKRPLPAPGARPLIQNLDAALMELEVPLEQGPNVKNGFKRKHPAWSMCERILDCPNCGANTPRKVAVVVDGKTEYREHKCGWEVCAHCREFQPKTHLCYLRKVEWKEPGPPESYVCVDIECDTQGYHTPYLIRACAGLGDRGPELHGPGRPDEKELKEMYLGRNLGGYDEKGRYVGATPEGNFDKDGKQVWFWFEGDGAEKKFIQWCLDKRKADKRGFTVIAHNGSGYDYAVMYKAIYLAGDDQVRKSLKTVYRGTRLINISFGTGEQQISYIDFYLHVASPLAGMVKTFGLKPELQAAGLSLEKEHFPHLLHDRTYRGPLPPVRFYPKKGNKAEQDKFEAWHAKEKLLFFPAPGQPMWDFREQSREYNHHDVELLRRACREFRLESMAATAQGDNAGCDPLRYVTTPAACMAVYRWLDLQDKSVPNLSLPLNRIFRRALSGGRVEATQFYWPTFNTPATERLYKIDINSLYPAVQVEFRYPLGYPDDYYGSPRPDSWPFGTPQPHPLGADLDDELLDELLHEDRFAFLVVDVEAPTDLLTPVLPLKDQGKNKYSLEPKLQYACYSPMLRRAVAAGYRVTKLWGAALWREPKFPDPALGIWTSYVKRVMREKDEAADYPADCKSAEQKSEYLQRYQAWPLNHNNQLRPERVENNPGRKAVAKLRANNLWGKFTQKEMYAKTRIFRSDEVDEFWTLLNDDKVQVLRIVPLDENSVECSYRPKLPEVGGGSDYDGSPRPEESMHAVIPGGLVPMYGQLKMYEYMAQIGDQRCYMDTDSLIYRYDPENKEHKFIGGEHVGPFLGQFKDELKEDGKDLRITHFGSAGAKNYVLLFADGQPGKSTVKGLPRSKLHPEFQWWFIKASVIAHALGVPDRAPKPVKLGVTRFLRSSDREGVQTVPWALQYGLVNDKVELFPDGSTLPLGHADVESKRQRMRQDHLFWDMELEEALAKTEQMRPQQAEWGGDEPQLAQPGKKRRAEGKDEKQQEEKEDRRRDRFNMLAQQASARLRREQLQEAEMIGDLDEEGLLDLEMALEHNPDPDMFDDMF